MKYDFDFYKKIRVTDGKAKKAFARLRRLHDKMPTTVGCLGNIEKENGCGGWCCVHQTPQLLYCEFLLIWDNISHIWSDDDLCDLFERCILNAVSNIPSKGCVFFHKETKLCKIHEVRPYNCRIYGITPPEEFNPRYEKLRVEYERIVGAVIRPQCESVSTDNGKVVTTEDTDRWWNHLRNIERIIGISVEKITDEVGGTYRTPHDHILLYNMPENVLGAVAGIKMYDNHMDKIVAVKQLIQVIKNVFKK